MRLYGIADYDNDYELMITQIFTSLASIPENETIYYTDEEDADINDFEKAWKIYSGNVREIGDAIKVGDKYVDYDEINAEDLPEEYTYTETLTRVDWDKLGECPRSVVYGVYKEGKKIDTKFVED